MLVKTPPKNRQATPNRRSAPQQRQKGKRKNRGANGIGSRNGTNGKVYGRRKKETRQISLPKIAAWKVILGALAIGIMGVLYLNHVFATRQLLQEVQRMEREYNRAKRRHAEYRLTFDRMIGPKEIYQKAQELGFVNGGPADRIITVEEE